MPGSRPLTVKEERLLVRHCRRLNPRDGALIAAQQFLGFRISEVLALTIGHVMHAGKIRSTVALPPRMLKGGFGGTRAIPVGPALARALERWLRRRSRHGELLPFAPLFLSRERSSVGGEKTLHRNTAEGIIKRALLHVGDDPYGLSSHSLRKSWAVRLYHESGHDLLLVRDGLGHGSVAATERYLPVRRGHLEAMIRRSDWTRRSPRGLPA